MLDSVDIDEISLNGGAKVDGLATQGRSPLHWAALCDSSHAAICPTEAGLKPTFRNREGDMAIHFGVKT
jgi:ankyrin repeat protein